MLLDGESTDRMGEAEGERGLTNCKV